MSAIRIETPHEHPSHQKPACLHRARMGSRRYASHPVRRCRGRRSGAAPALQPARRHHHADPPGQHLRRGEQLLVAGPARQCALPRDALAGRGAGSAARRAGRGADGHAHLSRRTGGCGVAGVERGRRFRRRARRSALRTTGQQGTPGVLRALPHHHARRAHQHRFMQRLRTIAVRARPLLAPAGRLHGFQIDAEVPGEVPAAEVVYP